MKDTVDLIKEAQTGPIVPKTPRRKSDIIIGTIEEDDRAKMLYTVTALCKQTWLHNKRRKTPLWKLLLLRAQTELCENALTEKILLDFGEISHKHAIERNISNYTLEVRSQWEVVISPKKPLL